MTYDDWKADVANRDGSAPEDEEDRGMECTYCTAEARGYGESGDPTCGAESCEPATRPIDIVEISAEDEDACSPPADGGGE